MMKAYINYPNPHVTAHFDPGCSVIRAQHKLKQRYSRITVETISEELQKFQEKLYPFAASQEINDMWLEIDFDDRDFELAVLNMICKMLGTYYRPLTGIIPSIHC
jgi:hypothetical protein